MTDLREAAQQALEALEGLSEPYYVLKAQDALRAALEQPEQEPVASIYVTIGGDREFDDWRCPLPVGGNLLYTHPPRREWRGLTEEEHEKARHVCRHVGVEGLVLWLEDKLKERNA